MASPPAAHVPPRPGPVVLTGPVFAQQLHRDPIATLLDASRRGDVVRMEAGGRVGTQWLLNSLDDIRHVLARSATNYVKDGFEIAFKPVFGESLIAIEAPHHRLDRKQFASSFQHRSLDWTIPVIEQHTQRLIAGWNQPRQVNLAAELMRFAATLSAHFTLGLDDPGVAIQMQDHIRGLHRVLLRRERMRWPLPWWAPTRLHRRFRRHHAAYDQILWTQLHRRKADLADQPDMLSMLLRWQREGVEVATDLWIRDQVSQLFLAGYEPVANTMAWTIYLLSQHPQFLRQVEAEASRGDTRPYTTENLPQRLAATQMSINEAMRLKTPTWLLARRTVAADTLPSGHDLPADARILISPYALHRREDLYPDPERFDPGRFAPELHQKRSPYAFIPFGGGPRICLGEHLARIITAIVVSRLTAHATFTRADDQPVELENVNNFTSQPRDGALMMQMTPRGTC